MKDELFYAEVIESTRFRGTRLISFHEFKTEEESEKFINDYNQILFETCEHGTPEVYTIAQTGGYMNIHNHKLSKLQDETFSK